MNDSMFDAFFNDPKSPHYVPPKLEEDWGVCCN